MSHKTGIPDPDTGVLSKEDLEAGVTCPCCGQFAKIYHRTITGTMARGLIYLVKKSVGREDPWFVVYDIFFKAGLNIAKTGDFAKLRFWDLIENEPGQRLDGSNRSGVWRVTDKGQDFAMNRLSVPRYARVFNNTCLGHSGPLVSITYALGNQFNYEQILKETP